MNKPTQSSNYRTNRLNYPQDLDMKCPICGASVYFLYSNAGKLVHCLDEDIYQIVDLYRCQNSSCEMSKLAFNPTTRFDYGGRSWGVDVLRYIAKEYLVLGSSPASILKRLELEFPKFLISQDSINRICDDLLEMKAFRIDERTRDIIMAQKMILLGLDGQDPGSDADPLWLFLDMISGRILATTYFQSLSHETLHEYLESMLSHYRVPVIGWVSDKQGVITKCHDTFYSQIPHQYCQFHFLHHLWDNLECLDSNVFNPLKEMITHLYIHSTTNDVKFDWNGKMSVKQAFKPMDDDLQAMIKVRNKVFKELRGIWLFDQLTVYVMGIRKTLLKMDPELRVFKIMAKAGENIEIALETVKPYYQQALELFGWFQKIRTHLGDGKLDWQEQQRLCDLVFQNVWKRALEEDPKLTLEKCKSFLPHKTMPYVKILGEWCRLWNSYLPGLFQYFQFPGSFRTNGLLERLFSLEKCALVTRAGKSNVSHMIATRGDAYLRITHCEREELMGDITIDFREELVKALRIQLQDRISKQTAKWRTRDRSYEGFKGIQMTIEAINEKMTKMEVR